MIIISALVDYPMGYFFLGTSRSVSKLPDNIRAVSDVIRQNNIRHAEGHETSLHDVSVMVLSFDAQDIT